MHEEYKAGRDLDALIWERVMSHVVQRWKDHRGVVHVSEVVPHYSTDVTAAWSVIEHLRTKKQLECNITAKPLGWSVLKHEIDPDGVNVFLVQITNRMAGWPKPGRWPVGHGETMPLAVCRAALVVCREDGGNPWED